VKTENPAFPRDAEIRIDPENGTILQVKAADLAGGLPADGEFSKALKKGDFGKAALEFLEAFQDRFRLRDPSRELNIEEVGARDSLGQTRVRLTQVYRGLPIFGAVLQVHFTSAGQVGVVEGRYLPTPADVDLNPVFPLEKACRELTDQAEFSGKQCRQEGNPLLFPVSRKTVRLAYRVILEGGDSARWEVIIDALDGTILNRRNLTQSWFQVPPVR